MDHPEFKQDLQEAEESESGISFSLSLKHLCLKNEQYPRKKHWKTWPSLQLTLSGNTKTLKPLI